MTVTADGSINPETIITGQQLRVFDASYSTGEDIKTSVIYVNETRNVGSTNGSSNLTIANASSMFVVGDTVIWGSGQPTPFLNNTTYWIVYVSPSNTFIRISGSKSGTPVTATQTGSGNLAQGCANFPYSVLRPYPVTSPILRTVVFNATTFDGDVSTKNITFYTILSASAKPTKSSTFSNTSIFIYNATTATIINRGWTPNNGFLYSDLVLTGSINKAGTASFVVTSKGTQTTAEENLLLSDNLVAIISGTSVIWSGKILRSEQSKMTLYNSISTVKQWDIECESDISRLRFQNVKQSNKGTYSGTIGNIVSKIVENDLSTDINWNGTLFDPALRSNEGPNITYTITNSDMYSQLSSLRSVIDFDLRDRLCYQRYYFFYWNPSTNYFDFATLYPYTNNDFANKWVIYCGDSKGVYSYGLCSSSGAASIYCPSMVNESYIPIGGTGGTLIILGNPVIDFVSDLSQPSKQATFYMNAPRVETPSFGYEFDDKTDRKTLATKVVAKGKNSSGLTITSQIAAVTPYDPSIGTFEKTTIITHRFEGTVVNLNIITSGTDAGHWVSLDGWGYNLSTSTYCAIKNSSGVFYPPNAMYQSYLHPIATPTETILNSQRVTLCRFLYFAAGANPGWDVGTQVFWMTSGDYPSYYASIYIKNRDAIKYVNGMDILIGGETITTIDIIEDLTLGYRIRYLCDGTTNHRGTGSLIHIPGSLVWKSSEYSETNPTKNIGSPVYYHGIILQTYTADQNVSTPILEVYATMYLLANSYYYRKATFWCPIYDFYKTDAREQYQLTTSSFLQPGDRIVCFSKSTDLETDQIYGQLKNVWQIVSFTYNASTLQVTVNLGDFERNVFTLLSDKTASINATIT